MTSMTIFWLSFAILIHAGILLVNSADDPPPVLKKKYTLVVPMMAPNAGGTTPMGPVLTETVEFVLRLINNLTNVLPDYNLAVDIGDDKCQDFPAVQVTINMMANYQPKLNLTTSEASFYGEFHPANGQFSKETAKTGYVVPMFLGGICSGSCVAAAKFPQQFNFIDVVHACNDPSLGDRKKFPNFYRFLPSLIQVCGIRVQFLQFMGWHRAAIISDALPVSYSDAFNLMKALQDGNIEIVAQEFFIDDPTEAIVRLKAAGSRIIFTTCYATICPTLACTAVRQGLYGPKYVWIFRTATDLLSPGLVRPPWCEKATIDAFAERSIYIGADNEGNALNPDQAITQTGVSLRQYTDYLNLKTQGIQRNTGYTWRLFAFEMMHTAAFILHNMEMELNKRNQTLKDIILDNARRVELMELIRQKTLTIDVQGLYGKIAFQPNTLDPYTPVIIVDQVQNGIRKTVWIYDNPLAPNLTDRFRFRIPPKWDTRDGKPPKARPSFVAEELKIPNGFVVANWVFAALMIFCQFSVEIFRVKKQSPSSQDVSFSDLNTAAVIGAAIIQDAVFTFPTTNDLVSMGIFCKSCTALILIGLALLAGSLSIKLWGKKGPLVPASSKSSTAVHQSSSNQRVHGAHVRTSSIVVSPPTKAQRVRAVQKVVSLVAVVVVLVIVWYAAFDDPVAERFYRQWEDEVVDTIFRETWITCSASPNAGNWLGAGVAIDGLILIAGVLGAVRNRGAKLSTGSTMKEAGFTMYVLLSVGIVAVLALQLLNGPTAIFGVMTAFCYSCSLATTLILSRQTCLKLISNYSRQTSVTELTGQRRTTVGSSGGQVAISNITPKQ